MQIYEDQSQIFERESFFFLFIIFHFDLKMKAECNELQCRVLELKKWIKELDDED